MSERIEKNKEEEYIRIRDKQDATSLHYDPKSIDAVFRAKTKRLRDMVRTGDYIMNVRTGLRAIQCNLCGRLRDGSCKCNPKKVGKRKSRS